MVGKEINMGFEKEFEQNMKQLMRLLKKMMTQYPLQGKDPAEVMKFLKDIKDKGPEVNIFFLNLAPLSPEEYDEIEEMLEADFVGETFKSSEMKCELSFEDKEFLKKHGIKY